ncbi:hypothetical protein D7X74_21330 [Corallococcus sp. CA047B]|uniref:hypothetical protein n=1 Tax=Corallococcus sp. CA047B TaxID=2316729 RepID=UPI000EB82FC4|nr:hypothetical protein [Corallococcus sp. CA047B]RKH13792.1 hypothetical protein D7X74_21330 [Corallococcus sp. CA047B]
MTFNPLHAHGLSKTRYAVELLATMDAPLRARLQSAIWEFGMADDAQHHPPALWPEAHAIHQDATHIAGEQNEGSIAATLNAMSSEELMRLAERLFSYYVKLAEGED